MARKTKSGLHQLNLYNEMKDILEEFGEEVFELKEAGLDDAADHFVTCIERASPQSTYDYSGKETPSLKNTWERTTEYKSVRYVNSLKLNDKRIPIANLLEFGSKGKPFIRMTFERERENLYQIIKRRIEKDAR
jgi:hypothetical protein